VNEDLSVLRGNHQLALGANGAMWWTNNYSTFYATGGATFNGQVTGLGMTDFFMGNIFQWTAGSPSAENNRSDYIALYGADTWKVNQKLTLNYGLRWEPFLPIVNLDRSAVHFDADALRKGLKTTQFVN